MRARQAFLLLATGLAVLLPFIPLALWAVAGRWQFPALLPQEYSLRALTYLTETAGQQVASSLAASTWLALVTTVAALAVAIPAGRALGLYRFRLKPLVLLLFTLPLLVPPLSVSMGLHRWFLALHLTETFGGVVLVHLTVCLPYTIFVLYGVFADYPPELEEQARSLGASPVQVFCKVTLPIILPGITVAALFSFLVSWSQYLSTLIIGGGKLLTLPILLFSLVDSGDRPVAGAVCLLFVIPAFLALLVSARNLSRASLQGVR